MEARNSPSKRLKLSNEQDFISSLSDTLLHHILSFLDTKYAVQTCILAKRWRYLWNSLRTLKFNEELFDPDKSDQCDGGFERFGNNVLMLRDNSDIKSFHYKGEGDIVLDYPLHKWIISTVGRNVEELYFDIRFDEIQFPECLFTCNSLTKLIVETGGTESSEHKRFKIILPDSIDLPQLKTLHLDSVLFVQEDSTNKLFSSCPNLEFLSITNSEFRQMNVSISSHKLKHLRLENLRLFHSVDSKFKLDTPNLTSFTCKDYASKNYILENISSVVKADIQMTTEEGGEPSTYKSMDAERIQMYAQRMMAFLKALHKVEDLRLSAWFIKVVSRVPNLLESQLTQFCNLRSLKLEIWRAIDSMVAITCLLNVSPLIESLSVKISQCCTNAPPNSPLATEDLKGLPQIHLLQTTMETTISGSKKLKASNEQINGSGDRISALPDSILHHILSFINLEYSVQTSFLSRRWRYFWTSLPTLNFNYKEITIFPSILTNFVDQALLRRDNSNVGRFELFYCTDSFDTITVGLNSWIFYALRRNVREICLTLSFDRLFRFPHRLFTSTSLTLLELSHWGINQHKLSLPNSISLPALKTLSLVGFEFEDYHVANHFFANCPLLESLTIQNCEMQHTHIIISLLQLEHLVIKNADVSYDNPSPADGSLKLYAPNLIYFCCEDVFFINYLLEDLPSLVEAKVHIEIHGEYSNLGGAEETSDQNLMKFLKSVQHVKALTLSASVILVFARAYALLESSNIQFCNLRCLKLEGTLLSSECIHAIAYLLKISPNVETLSLSLDEDQELYDKHLEEYACWDKIKFTSTSTEDYLVSRLSLQCLLHHLKYVEIRGISGCINELKFLEILLKNAMVLKKVILFSSKESHDKEAARKRWMMKFSERLLTFPTAASPIAFLFF